MATLLLCSLYIFSRYLDKINGDVGLSQLHVAAGSVDEDLNPVQAHVNVGALGVPQLLADLDTDARVDGRLKWITFSQTQRHNFF